VKGETHSVHRRIVTYAMLGILLTGVVVGLATAVPFYLNARAGLEQSAGYNARLRALAVAQLLAKWEDLTRQVTSRSVIRERLEAYYRGEMELEALVSFSVPKLADAMRLSSDISGITRLDLAGQPLVTVGSAIPHPLLPKAEGLGRELRARGPVAFAGAWHLLITAPILNPTGERVGSDVVAFRIEPLIQVLRQAVEASPGSRAYLTHSDDNTVLEAHPGGGGVIHGGLPVALAQALGRALAGESNIVRPGALNDTGEVIFFLPVEQLWALAVVAPSDRLYAPALQILALPVASIALMIVLGSFGTVRLIRPLSRAVVEKTIELATLATEQRSLLEHARGFVYRQDEAGNVTYLSGSVEAITGYGTEEIKEGFQRYFTDHPCNRRAQAYAQQVRTGEHVPPYTIEIYHHSGTPIALEISERPVLDGNRPVGVVGVARDVTERTRTAEALAQSEERLRTVIDATPDIICFKDGGGHWLESNHANLETFRLIGTDFRGKKGAELTPFTSPLLREALLAAEVADEYAWRRGAPSRSEEAIPGSEGKQRIFDVMRVPIFSEAGERRGLVVVGRDISERKWAEEELRLAASVFRESHEGIVILDHQHRILRINAAGAASLGLTAEELQGRDLCERIDKERDEQAPCSDLARLVEQRGSWQGEVWYRRTDGHAIPTWQHVSAIRDEEGHIARFAVLFTDLSEKKDSEERIRYLADFDPLTGLPNRTRFTEILAAAADTAGRIGGQLALLFIDLDRFKNVNDSLGHQVGDKLLQQVAQRLSASARDQDIVARLGGDEFTLLLGGLHDERDAGAVAHHLLEGLAAPLNIDDYEIFVAASIGISIFPRDGEDARTLIRNADAAMYRAKEQGRNTYQYYTPELTDLSFERLELEGGLRRAIERGELLLHYQPQLDANEQVVGVEALVRWRHPERGVVSPTLFIPLAEDTGLIDPIGEWVLTTACHQAYDWMANGVGELRMAVNLSGWQIIYGDIVTTVRRVLAETSLPPRLLELEITEGFVLQHAERGVSTLSELRALGVTLAIDDFGTGYSSLSYLKRLPVDRLKIDRSFVCDIPDDRDDAAITTTIIGMARHLGLKVIAEGVETAVQLEFLRDHGCDEFQGYYLSKPLSAEELEQFMRHQSVTHPGV